MTTNLSSLKGDSTLSLNNRVTVSATAITVLQSAVTALQTGIALLGSFVAASTSPTFSSLMARDGSGRSQVTSPSVNNDIANKAYVDSSIAAFIPALTINSVQTANFNVSIYSHNPVNISSNSVTASLPDANSNIGKLCELFISSAPSSPGTYSLFWNTFTLGDSVQGTITALTEPGSSVQFRSVGGGIWRIVARS